MELPIFNISDLDEIDIESLYFQNSIFDIENFRFLPIKSQNKRTIAVIETPPPELIHLLNFHWQTSISVKFCDKNNLLEWIHSVQLILIDNKFAAGLIDDNLIPIYVNAILVHAIRYNASDLHIESYENTMKLRLRINGVLTDYKTLPQNISLQLLARIKIIANISTTEHIFPQDGAISFLLNSHHKIAARVATIPTLQGEKIVIRFHNFEDPLKLEELYLTTQQLRIIKSALNKPNGVILITGPTGSGKTSTLYSMLQVLNNLENNIISIENPVERIIPNINQVNIRPETGFDFKDALKAVLRLDPDIIMIGEIRDFETAAITYNAAETGHLILASLHSNNAQDAIKRLQTLKINKQNIISDTILIIAQRLLRKLCALCKIPNYARINTYLAKGCSKCFSGYHGQVPIFEILTTSSQQPITNLRREALRMLNLGITTQSEILRILGIML
jgi:type II secretory ATPase GspE/PulE/Tfp pilus assembly ATPase PilB-like protein